MIRFELFRFPVAIHWFFWLTCFLLGGGATAQGADWIRVVIWTGVVLVSIMIHELGHALAGRHFGAYPQIALHGLGGLTCFPGVIFKRKENILVSAAGPAASLGLGTLIWLITPLVPIGYPLTGTLIVYGLWVNFGWSILNLLPIQPLDGGQILRDILGPKRRQITCGIGFIVGVSIAILAIKAHLYIMAILMGFLAYQNLVNRSVIPGSNQG